MHTLIQYIPSNLNLDELLKNTPKRSGIKKEKLIRLVSMIIESDSRRSKKRSTYIKIKHKQFQKSGIPDFKLQKEFLIEKKVIECNNKYLKGKYPMGYRLTKRYRTAIIPVEIKSKTIIKAYIKLGNKRVLDLDSQKNLSKWFNNKLQIDGVAALKHAKSELSITDIEDVYKQNRAVTDIIRIQQGNYIFRRDNTSRRLHTNLTRLKKQLRRFVSYEGKPLVSVDMVNAQPFLLSLLLDPDFYSANPDSHKISLKHLINKEVHQNSGKIPKYQRLVNQFVHEMRIERYWEQDSDSQGVSKSLSKIESYKLNRLSNLIASLSESNALPDISSYISTVEGGTFYENFGEQIKSLSQESISREDLKTITCKVLFSSNRTESNEKDTFSSIYPTVYDVIHYWKQDQYPLLAILLQAIESDLIIDRISERISKERPDLPLYTIHDSLVTVKGEENYIKCAMQQEMTKAIGRSCAFKTEFWEL